MLEIAHPVAYGEDWLAPSACPILAIFVRLWADTASSDEVRGRIAAATGDLAGTRSTRATEAERMLAIAAWGKDRYNQLHVWGRGSFELQQHMLTLTASRTYPYKPLAEFAAWLAPPIDSRDVPDVLLAASARAVTVGEETARVELAAMAHASQESARILVAKLGRVTKA